MRKLRKRTDDLSNLHFLVRYREARRSQAGFRHQANAQRGNPVGGFGFRTHAALQSQINTAATERAWDEAAASYRADKISSDRLASAFPQQEAVLGLGTLKFLDLWKIERIADLAERASNDRWAMGLNGGGTMSDIIDREQARRDSGEWPTPARHDLETSIRAMTPDELYEIQAVMWLARFQYFGSWNWGREIEHAHVTHDEHSYDYVLGKGLLGQNLRTGLRMLAKNFCCEVVATN